MSLEIRIAPIAEIELRQLPPTDQATARRVFDNLRDHPIMYQTAGLRGKPDVRRAVAGHYLIFYRYFAGSNLIEIYRIRDGRRKPLGPSKFP